MQKLAVSREQKRWLCQEYKRVMGYPHYGTENWDCPIRVGLFIDNIGNVRADETGNSCDIYFTPHFASTKTEPVSQIWHRLLEVRDFHGNVMESAYVDTKVVATCPKMREAQRVWETEHGLKVW